MPPDRRPPPLPDRRPILDQQPERRDVRHGGVDGAAQAPLKRTATLPQMAALKAPPVAPGAEAPLPGPGTLTGLPAPAAPGSAPPPPALPLEFAPTKRPAAPWGRTMRAPTPPEVVAAARRIETPPAGSARSSLPPASGHPDDGSKLAQRREIERVTAERDQARAQVQLEQLRAQEQAAVQDQARLDAAAKLATLQLEIEREKTKQATAPARPWLDERLTKALVALLTALAGLGIPLGIWLTAKATALESKQERQEAKSSEVATVATAAKAESSASDKELDALKRQLGEERAYNREVLRRMGVEVPKREGDPEPPKLKTGSTPLRKPGAVTPAPVLVVTTPPP